MTVFFMTWHIKVPDSAILIKVTVNNKKWSNSDVRLGAI